MIEIPLLEDVHYRMAVYYLRKLQIAEAAYLHGHEESGYALIVFDQEWPHIQQWQTWAAGNFESSEIVARLCVDFLCAGENVLLLRLTPDQRIDWLNSGLAAARALGDQPALVGGLLQLAWAVHKQSSLGEAQALAQEALSLAEQIGDRLAIGRALHLLGEIAHRRGEYDLVQDLQARSLVILTELNADVHLAPLYFSMSELAYVQGDIPAARDNAQRSYEIFQKLGLKTNTTNIGNWRGIMLWASGEQEEGERAIRENIEECRMVGAWNVVAHGLYELGRISLEKGDYTAAITNFAEGMEIARSIGEEWLMPIFYAEQGRAAVLTGEYAPGAKLISEAVATARASGYDGLLGLALLYLSEALIGLGDAPGAAAALREGLAQAATSRDIPNMATACMMAAFYWHRFKDGGDALAARWIGLIRTARGADSFTVLQARVFSAKIEAVLGREQFAEAAARGQSLTLDDAIRDLRDRLAGE